MEVNPWYINFLFTPCISPALYRFLPMESVERLCYRYPEEWNHWSVRATPKSVKDWITTYYVDNNWTISFILKWLTVETISDDQFELNSRNLHMAEEAKPIDIDWDLLWCKSRDRLVAYMSRYIFAHLR